YRQQRTLIEQAHGAFVIFFYGRDEVEGLIDLQVSALGLEFVERPVHAFGHVQFACPAAAGDFEAYHGFAVEQRGGTALGDGVADGRDVGQADGAAVAQYQAQVGQLFRAADVRERTHGLFGIANVRASARALELYLPQLARDVGGRG